MNTFRNEEITSFDVTQNYKQKSLFNNNSSLNNYEIELFKMMTAVRGHVRKTLGDHND